MKELLPGDTPTTLVHYVRITYFIVANLFLDKLNGCSVTCILHLSNKTPVDWYYDKQITVETATYGYEFFPPVHVWNILFIWGIIFDTLVDPSDRKDTCLEIPNMLLTVPSNQIPSYIRATLMCPFIKYGILLHIIWLPFTVSMEYINHLKSYQRIGVTTRSGDFYSHCYFVREIPWNFWIWS